MGDHRDNAMDSRIAPAMGGPGMVAVADIAGIARSFPGRGRPRPEPCPATPRPIGKGRAMKGRLLQFTAIIAALLLALWLVGCWASPGPMACP
jgi:hypothetical protein